MVTRHIFCVKFFYKAHDAGVPVSSPEFPNLTSLEFPDLWRCKAHQKHNKQWENI